MKILKKFFLVSLFCSLFVVNASALDTYNLVNTYTDDIATQVSNYLSNNNISNIDFQEACNSIYNNNYTEYNYYMCNLSFSNNKPELIFILWNDYSVFNSASLYKNDSSTWVLRINNHSSSVSFDRFYYSYSLENNEFLFNGSSPSSFSSENYYFLKQNFNTGYLYFWSGLPLFTTLVSTNIDYLNNLNIPIISQSSSTNINIKFNDNYYGLDYGSFLPLRFLQTEEFKKLIGYKDEPKEPSYTYVSNVLDNGNVELTFSFENYDSTDSSYAFTIENEISGEEYGIENPFSSIFPKVIPYGDSYTITIPYDTYLYITLAKYNKVDDSTLYLREEIFTDVLDINNIVFSNPSNPYFSIDYQSKKFIQGRFNNTKNNDTCFVKFSNNSNSRQVSCTESFTINYDFNGFLTFYVKRNNDTIYTRNINILGNDSVDYPYITYNVEKQDFYSVVTFNVINGNYDINMSYRYSLDNGVTWTDYQLIEKEPFSYSINVFSNSNVIFEIVNVRSPNNIIVYDSKSVYVVLDISTASGLNSSTNNLIDKFISLISINDNLINYINLLWNNFKNSKLFLIIMIPFISSIICGIIYLIRRK